MTKNPHRSCPSELCLIWPCPAPSQDIKVGWRERKAGRWGRAGSSGPRAPESGPLATVRKHMPDCEGGVHTNLSRERLPWP